MEENRFVNNTEQNRYELHSDGHVAIAEYTIDDEGVVCITHTGVPKPLEGKGIGSELIGKSLRDIKEQGRTVSPVCPFVEAYIRRHPEWKPLVKTS